MLNSDKLIKNIDSIIEFGNYYNLNVDERRNRIMANEVRKKEILMINLNSQKNIKYPINCDGMFDGGTYNCDRQEYYFYDEIAGRLFVLDEDFNIKNTKQISSPSEEYHSGDRIFFTERNIILILEKGKLYKLNIDTLEIMHSANIPDRSDYAVINKFRKSCLITFWLQRNYLIEYSMDSNEINKIEFPMMQGYIQISDKNKEIYLAYHQRGRIYVYDAQTYQLKRKIKTNYTVKNITYDNDLDILIAPSYIKGYVDIFLMDGSDKLIWHGFVGHMIRMAKFDVKKENLFVTSQYGVYKIPINIKEIIKFHVKQSIQLADGKHFID